ncbi:hypothetical protein N656DRAFT_212318 [Canariomyces notabilis]|uniref:Uncharacterized protein n=1 Tax=Canariomyces notabilis TaxID=2074819 RepID=A0AAN6TAT6_9PEZI|nr:hypothetical protein N656DRAFT_212318 [Canariomyces arenarius]
MATYSRRDPRNNQKSASSYRPVHPAHLEARRTSEKGLLSLLFCLGPSSQAHQENTQSSLPSRTPTPRPPPLTRPLTPTSQGPGQRRGTVRQPGPAKPVQITNPPKGAYPREQSDPVSLIKEAQLCVPHDQFNWFRATEPTEDA